MLTPAGQTRLLTLLLDTRKIKLFRVKEDGHPQRIVYKVYKTK